MKTRQEGNAKRKVLVFPFNLLSHYLRCLVLANRYSRDDYEILFHHSDNYANFISEHHYDTFRCEQFDPVYAIECSTKFSFIWLNEKDIERIYLSQLSAIRDLKPDLVIGDAAPCLKMASESAGVEYVAVMNGYLTRFYSFTRKLSRTHKAHGFLSLLPATLADKITHFAEQQKFIDVHRPFKNLRAKYKLKELKNYLYEIEGDQNLICDLPDLFPQKDLPENFRFIPPLIYRNARAEGDWLLHLDKNKPVICVCMGSTGNWEALKFLNHQRYADYTIITAGDTGKVIRGEHILAQDFANLDEVLEHSDLMICHGGNGTIYCGLTKGVFMLCLTSHFEQEWNVHALERSGYGRLADGWEETEWQKQISLPLQKAVRSAPRTPFEKKSSRNNRAVLPGASSRTNTM